MNDKTQLNRNAHIVKGVDFGMIQIKCGCCGKYYSPYEGICALKLFNCINETERIIEYTDVIHLCPACMKNILAILGIRK